MRPKPVYECTAENMWDYEFNAMRYLMSGVEILGSDSIINLKREIKERRWRLAHISCKTGSMSLGQYAVDDYPYQPRY